MLIYSGTKKQFDIDVKNKHIADKIKSNLYKHGIFNDNYREYVSWENSLTQMHSILADDCFSDDIQIAVEYQIPQTSKRVDFIIAGKNKNNVENVVIIELKQWNKAMRTSRDGLVIAYTGGMNRAVAHPSYQAYSYAKTIENFNTIIEKENINLYPCVYLHNYKKTYINQLLDPLYSDVVSLAPIFIKSEEKKFREFIKKYVINPSNRNILKTIDNGKIRPSKSLQDTLASMLNGNQEFILLDEQKVVYETVKRLVEESIQNNKKYTVIVEGGPGTGKSVVAISLLVELISNLKLNANYITKNAAPRNVYFEKLKQGKFKLNYVKFLFKGSGVFINSKNNEFDCLLVDEAHRLNEKSGIYQNKGENQIKEIINASRVSVFFIDENQVVTSSDIGSVSEIKKWAKECGSTIFYNEDMNLSSQFRCNGSDEYIAFLDDLLGIHTTSHADKFDLNFEIKTFESPIEMREQLRKKNYENNKARMVAGYCYEWLTKKSNDPSIYDIELHDGFKARWNFDSTQTWAIDQDSFDQVGCIHTSQGLEFDYVGVIIGKDLLYKNGSVITDVKGRAKSDYSLRGIKNDPNCKDKVDRIIKNTYKTLLTRGQKGCYIYCEDKALHEYINKKLERTHNQNK